VGTRADKRVVSFGLEHAPYGGKDGLVDTSGPARRGESWEGWIRVLKDPAGGGGVTRLFSGSGLTTSFAVMDLGGLKPGEGVPSRSK